MLCTISLDKNLEFNTSKKPLNFNSDKKKKSLKTNVKN